MPHVVTQSCVGDGSCVYACPVNCIQPTPDDPAFELAEMLHVDPATCVDCGACVSACPVDAIKPAWRLDPDEQAFAAINAVYHGGRVPDRAAAARGVRGRPLLAPVRPALAVRRGAPPLRVAIVGSGPAAMYAAEEVLTIPGARVSVYERDRTAFGLVRAGVAPDHRRTRRVARQLDRIAQDPRLTLHLGTEVGTDVTHDELAASHDAVIYGVGAATDRRLDIPGAERALTATEIVGWYNGRDARTLDLSAKRAVVVGNGNVALDIARILTIDPEALAGTEIAPAALAALRESRIEEVVVTARRGPEHSAFTLPELVGLSATPGVSLTVQAEDLSGDDAKLELLRGLGPARPGERRITLRYGLTPSAVHDGAVEFGTDTIAAGLLVTAIGYRGLPVPGLPFDPVTGTVPNEDGRVSGLPGTYVVGWIKRGPTGFIGTNKGCAQDTVAALVDDYNRRVCAIEPSA